MEYPPSRYPDETHHRTSAWPFVKAKQGPKPAPYESTGRVTCRYCGESFPLILVDDKGVTHEGWQRLKGHIVSQHPDVEREIEKAKSSHRKFGPR